MTDLHVRVATADELDELADVAARTFPLACPPSVAAADVATFIEATLSRARFAEYLTDPGRIVLTARSSGRILGYAMLIRGVPDDPDVQSCVTVRPAVELSKIYVLPDGHGAGVSAALFAEALERARAEDAKCMWLGVNQQNQRAQRFYAKNGFTRVGTKSFQLGSHVEHDYVMMRSLAAAMPQ